jgi:predicted Na+-dependent transporter
LLFSVPTAVSGFVWVAIYRGNGALALTLIFLDTLVSPLVVPATMSLLLGAQIAMDMTGIAISLVVMVMIPTIIGVAIHEASRGKIPALASPYLSPLAKICLVLVVAANAAAAAPYVDLNDPKLLKISLFCIIFSVSSYVFAKFLGAICRFDAEKRVTVFFAVGLRNISAAASLAIEYLPPPAAIPVILGIVFQQSIAAIMGKAFKLGKKIKSDA